MTDTSYRCYPRNSPQAAGRILITALLANGDLKAAEWQRLAETSAFDRLGLQGLQWHAVMGELQKETLEHLFAMRGVLDPDQARMFDKRVVKALTTEAR